METVLDVGKVFSQGKLAEGIYSMWIETAAAKNACGGQFVNLYLKDPTRLLPRPISICDVDREDRRLRVVYRIAGAGTKALSALGFRDEIRLMGPLGNGFPETEETQKRVVLIGGGIGIPPMLLLAKKYGESATAVLGYRDADTFLLSDFKESGCGILLSSDDGSVGTKGTVIDAIEEADFTADVIFACGPKPMLSGIRGFARKKNIPCYVSMEERMACGIGACLGCVTPSADKDAHSHVCNKRVCKDGPVFLAEEVVL